MSDKPKKVFQASNKQASIVTVVLVMAILALLAVILLRALSPTSSDEANAETVNAGTAPVISHVALREVWTDESLVVYQDVYFTDADGDAARVDFTLIETTAEDVYVEDGIISERPEVQREIAIHTGTWTCHSGRHTVTLQVEIIDQNNNRSAAHMFTITCRN